MSSVNLYFKMLSVEASVEPLCKPGLTGSHKSALKWHPKSHIECQKQFRSTIQNYNIMILWWNNVFISFSNLSGITFGHRQLQAVKIPPLRRGKYSHGLGRCCSSTPCFRYIYGASNQGYIWWYDVSTLYILGYAHGLENRNVEVLLWSTMVNYGQLKW